MGFGCLTLNRLGRETCLAAWKDLQLVTYSISLSGRTWLHLIYCQSHCGSVKDVQGCRCRCSASDHNCCLDRAAVTMRGISAGRVVALSQFTQAPGPHFFPCKCIHACTKVHAYTQTPSPPMPWHTTSPVACGNCSNTHKEREKERETERASTCVTPSNCGFN